LEFAQPWPSPSEMLLRPRPWKEGKGSARRRSRARGASPQSYPEPSAVEGEEGRRRDSQVEGETDDATHWRRKIRAARLTGEWRGRAVQLAGTPAEGGGGATHRRRGRRRDSPARRRKEGRAARLTDEKRERRGEGMPRLRIETGGAVKARNYGSSRCKEERHIPNLRTLNCSKFKLLRDKDPPFSLIA
jgi:hypothetical protein